MAAPDWLAIEGDFRAGKKSVRAIAAEYEISDTAIRKRAKKEHWAQNPAATQREKVKAHFAGSSHPSSQCEPRTLDDATARAIGLEDLALGNAEQVLRRIRAELADDKRDIASADLKRLSESNAINLATARTVLSLDDPQEKPLVLEVPERGRELD